MYHDNVLCYLYSESALCCGYTCMLVYTLTNIGNRRMGVIKINGERVGKCMICRLKSRKGLVDYKIHTL